MDLKSIEGILIGGFAFLGGAFVGGTVQAVVNSYERFEEAKGLAIALRAEISSIRAVVEARAYVSGLDQLIQQLSDSSHQVGPEDVFAISVQQDYMEVFSASLPKIGLLGELSGPVVGLYSVVKSLLDDIAQLVAAQQRLVDGKPLSTAPNTVRTALLAAMTETRGWMVSALQQAPAVETQLERFSKKKFWRVIP
jgi:hypothetical protein